jgi:hypothetical protein
MAYRGSSDRFRKIRGDRFVANMGGEAACVKWTCVDSEETGPNVLVVFHDFYTQACIL